MSIGSIFCRTRDGKVESMVTVKAGMTTLNVPCEVVGPFAIHRSIAPNPGLNVTLTHIRSGLVVRRFSSRKIARQVAAALVDLGDWNRPESRLTKQLKNAAGRTINRMAPLSQ